jgi:hypothetical protein
MDIIHTTSAGIKAKTLKQIKKEMDLKRAKAQTDLIIQKVLLQLDQINSEINKINNKLREVER